MPILTIFKLLRCMFTVGFGFTLVYLALLQPYQVVWATGQPGLAVTSTDTQLESSSTTTAIKTVTPINPVSPGTVLTYTIAFTTSISGQVVVTDSVPTALVLQTATVTGTPAASITALVNGNLITWTVANMPPQSLVTLTFSAQVANTIKNGINITNTAWISNSAGVVSTNRVTSTVIASDAVYLPILHKPAFTILSIGSSNTGNFVVKIRQISDNSVVSTCNVVNNSTSPCDTPFPPGVYLVDVIGTLCGSVTVQRTFSPGPVTLPISC